MPPARYIILHFAKKAIDFAKTMPDIIQTISDIVQIMSDIGKTICASCESPISSTKNPRLYLIYIMRAETNFLRGKFQFLRGQTKKQGEPVGPPRIVLCYEQKKFLSEAYHLSSGLVPL